jgi:hypothetical protein
MPHRSRQEEDAVLVRRTVGLVTGLVALFIMTTDTPAQAQVDVIGHYSLVGSVYSYTFDVVNNTSDDVLLVSARLNDQTFVISNPSAPSGFILNYSEADGNGDGVPDGYLNFLPDIASNATFAPFTTTTPFTFDSPTLLGDFVFEGLDTNGDPVTGSVSVAPEPGTLALFLPGVLSTGILLRRRLK